MNTHPLLPLLLAISLATPISVDLLAQTPAPAPKLNITQREKRLQAISQQVSTELAKATVAQLPAAAVSVVNAGPLAERVDFLRAVITFVAKSQPTALVSVTASLIKALPDLSPEIAALAARSSPSQLSELTQVSIAAAPDQMAAILTRLAHDFPNNTAAIGAAAEKIYPARKAEILAAITKGEEQAAAERRLREGETAIANAAPAGHKPPQVPNDYGKQRNYGKP